MPMAVPLGTAKPPCLLFPHKTRYATQELAEAELKRLAAWRKKNSHTWASEKSSFVDRCVNGCGDWHLIQKRK